MEESIFASSKAEVLKGIYCAAIVPCIRMKSAVCRKLRLTEAYKSDPRFQKTEEYRSRHCGERVFIVATGPSLTMEDLEKLRNENTISMNSIVNVFSKTDFRPTYYMISDGIVYNRLTHAQTLMPAERVFVGIGNINTKWNINLKDVNRPEDKSINLFPVDRTRTLKHLYINKDQFNTYFSFEVKQGFADGGTITYLAMQMAVYMGFKEIYLLGVDCNFLGDRVHFDEKENSRKSRDIKTAYLNAFQNKVAYECARTSIEDTEVRIFNATRGGSLEVFPRVDFDSLF